MKKKHLTAMAMAVFMTAVISLQAQDSPNGIGTGTDPVTPIVEQKLWYRDGNLLSLTSGNMLGSTNAFPVRICTNNTDRMELTRYVIDLQKQIDELKK